jgi:hypothetical protein
MNVIFNHYFLYLILLRPLSVPLLWFPPPFEYEVAPMTCLVCMIECGRSIHASLMLVCIYLDVQLHVRRNGHYLRRLPSPTIYTDYRNDVVSVF